jgi:hypothetical protein
MNVQVKRIQLDTEHDNQKWLVLEGSIPKVPQVTKRRAINSAALADGKLNLADEKAKLIADVEEYYQRWLAVQEALKEL